MEQQGNTGGLDRGAMGGSGAGAGGMRGAGADAPGTSAFGSDTPSPAFGGPSAGTATDAPGGEARAGGAGPTGGRLDEIRTQAERGMKQAADRLDTLAQRIDSTADQRLAGAGGARGRAGDLAHGLADTLESVAGYLRENDVGGLQRDLERQVRERPIQTLLIGVAAGWVVGKILR